MSLHRKDREPYGSGGRTRAEASASLVGSPWFYGLIILDVRHEVGENPPALVSAEHSTDRVTAKPSYSGRSIRPKGGFIIGERSEPSVIYVRICVTRADFLL